MKEEMKATLSAGPDKRRIDVLLTGAHVNGESGYSMDEKPEWFNEELYQKGRTVGYEYGCGSNKHESEMNPLKILFEGDNIDGDCGNSMDVKPDWFDEETFIKGKNVAEDYSCGGLISITIGTIMMSQYENLMEPMVSTGSMATPDLAAKRVANTFEHGLKWSQGDIWDSQNFAYKSLHQVRAIHRNVAKRIRTNRPTDRPNGGIWFSQTDMALTQFSIMGSVILFPKDLGVHATEEEMESYTYFWRCVGYQLGLMDEYNLCKGTYQETKKLCKEIVLKIAKPTLLNPKQFYTEMAQRALEAAKTISLFIDYPMFVNWTFKLLEFEEVPLRLTSYGKLCDQIVKQNAKMMKIAVFRRTFTPWYKAKIVQWIQGYRNKTKEALKSKQFKV